MILLPAIDIKGGNVVRLFQGDFNQETGYDPHPVETADRWCSMGAQWLHLVDLDGAKNGMMGNKEYIIFITRKLIDRVCVEVGGGIRDEKTVKELISAGVKRVILGTRAIEDRNFLKQMLESYGEKICVSLDCSHGLVTHRGWVSATNIKDTDLALELEAMGVACMVYTDIARDGTLNGPNFEALEMILNTVQKTKVIASGGISSIDDVIKLKNLESRQGGKLWGAITGKALYEGKLDFRQAVKLLNAQ